MLKLIKNANEWLYLCLCSPIDNGWELAVPLTVEFLCNTELEAGEIQLIFKKFNAVSNKDPFKTGGLNCSGPSLLLFPGDNSWVIFGFCYKFSDNGTTVIAVPSKVGNTVTCLLNEFINSDDFYVSENIDIKLVEK